MGGPVLVVHEQNPEERLCTVVDVREYNPGRTVMAADVFAPLPNTV